jgi:hypothetical protein
LKDAISVKDFTIEDICALTVDTIIQRMERKMSVATEAEMKKWLIEMERDHDPDDNDAEYNSGQIECFVKFLVLSGVKKIT